MKVSKNELKLLLVFGGLLAFIALYFLVYNNLTTASEEVQAEINMLEPQLQELRSHEVNYQTYVDSIAASKQNIATNLQTHPPKIENEEFLIWMLGWEEANGLELTNIAFTGTTPISQFPLFISNGETEVLTEVETGKTAITTSGSLTYDELKNSIDDIYRYQHETSLDNVAVSFNAETGELMGNFAISKYYINYPGAPYNPITMPSVDLGNANPFGAILASPTEVETDE